jgi:hypothetical protein
MCMADRVDEQAPPPEDTPREGESVEDVVRRGRWSGTPFVALGSVAVAIWLFVGLVAAIVLLVWWLA